MASHVNAMSESMQEEFAEFLFKYLISPQDRNLIAWASAFGTKHHMNLEPLKKSIKQILELLSDAMQSKQSATELVEALVHADVDLDDINKRIFFLGMLASSAKVFANHWDICRAALLQRAQHLVLASPKLVNLTWKLGITAASNHVSELGSTFVHLSFIVDTGQLALKTESFEFSLENFYRFLANMEALERHFRFLNN